VPERIQEYDVRVEKIAKESYPHVELLKQVKGVGTQIALTYVLTLDDPHRFPKSREVGCFLGLRPGHRDGGDCFCGPCVDEPPRWCGSGRGWEDASPGGAGARASGGTDGSASSPALEAGCLPRVSPTP
jgi:Transposase IS116/IS110/IS902 family